MVPKVHSHGCIASFNFRRHLSQVGRNGRQGARGEVQVTPDERGPLGGPRSEAAEGGRRAACNSFPWEFHSSRPLRCNFCFAI